GLGRGAAAVAGERGARAYRAFRRGAARRGARRAAARPRPGEARRAFEGDEDALVAPRAGFKAPGDRLGGAAFAATVVVFAGAAAFAATGRSFAFSSGLSNVTTKRAPYAPATRDSDLSDGR